MQDATESLNRLRIVKDIPERFFGKDKAQAKAADILTALVNLIGQQLSYFAILQNRTHIEQRLGNSLSISFNLPVARLLKKLVSTKGGAYENAQKELEGSIAEFNQCLQDVDLKISIG